MALAKELTQLCLPEIGEATSAAATTRRCCMPAARSRSCARRDQEFEHDVNFAQLQQILLG